MIWICCPALGKAKSWRIMVTYLPVALYYSWQVGGTIPDTDAPRPKLQEKAAAEERRIAALVNERRHTHAMCKGDVNPQTLITWQMKQLTATTRHIMISS